MLNLHEKFIVDEKGKRTAAVLPYAEWKKVAAILEEYEDICAYDKAKSLSSKPVSFTTAVKKLKARRS
ncbi:MAG: hypothetical protein P4M12_00475 [Gammaproteobacteria bacterium]|nr:hypothetical protein [Gammaproteobacteria bacterium]